MSSSGAKHKRDGGGGGGLHSGVGRSLAEGDVAGRDVGVSVVSHPDVVAPFFRG